MGPRCPPDHGLALMWVFLAAGLGLALGKIWGDRGRWRRIMTKRRGER